MTKAMPEGESGLTAIGNPRGRFATVYRRLIAGTRFGTRGAAAIEFALVMPVLLSLAMGIIEYAWLYYVENQMSYVARAVARDVSAGVLPLGNAQNKVIARLGEQFPYTFNVPPPDFDTIDEDVTIFISIPMEDAALVNFLNLFGGGTLNASATMKMTTS
jgi:hypothetical protein